MVFHEAEYLNLPRMILQSSCAISGTGFLVHADMIKDNGGWIHHLLTETLSSRFLKLLKAKKLDTAKKLYFMMNNPLPLSVLESKIALGEGLLSGFRQIWKGFS